MPFVLFPNGYKVPLPTGQIVFADRRSPPNGGRRRISALLEVNPVSKDDGIRRLTLLVLRFPFPERRWREHSDTAKGIEDQQILIPRDNRSALASQGRRQHQIVVAVATGWGIECVWRHERERL
jgi:hypothetical protein